MKLYKYNATWIHISSAWCLLQVQPSLNVSGNTSSLFIKNTHCMCENFGQTWLLPLHTMILNLGPVIYDNTLWKSIHNTELTLVLLLLSGQWRLKTHIGAVSITLPKASSFTKDSHRYLSNSLAPKYRCFPSRFIDLTNRFMLV